MGPDSGCYLVEADINEAAGPEYFLILSWGTWASTHLYFQEQGKWDKYKEGNGFVGEWKEAAIRSALEKGDFRAEAPKWKDLYIGNTRLDVR
jgi:hypothetical protein